MHQMKIEPAETLKNIWAKKNDLVFFIWYNVKTLFYFKNRDRCTDLHE